jgi:hypothetical protein
MLWCHIDMQLAELSEKRPSSTQRSENLEHPITPITPMWLP